MTAKPKRRHVRTGKKPPGPARKIRRLGDFASVESPPADTLERSKWAHGILARAMFQAIRDPEVTDHARRRELVQIGRAMGALTPTADIAEVRRLLNAEEDQKEAQVAPALEEAPEDAG